eukprot:snap_masked-scaffold_75-processed-gene-0.45-mRNA-1 protein AED:1.00 eAED:1.00 QI:0/0/0/0/1/1/2/0/255
MKLPKTDSGNNADENLILDEDMHNSLAVASFQPVQTTASVLSVDTKFFEEQNGNQNRNLSGFLEINVARKGILHRFFRGERVMQVHSKQEKRSRVTSFFGVILGIIVLVSVFLLGTIVDLNWEKISKSNETKETETTNPEVFVPTSSPSISPNPSPTSKPSFSPTVPPIDSPTISPTPSPTSLAEFLCEDVVFDGNSIVSRCLSTTSVLACQRNGNGVVATCENCACPDDVFVVPDDIFDLCATTNCVEVPQLKV